MQEENIRKNIIESWTYLNGIPIDHKKIRPSELKSSKCETENIGISMISPAYIEINGIQDKDDEYKKIKKFLNKYVERYAEKIVFQLKI